MSSPEREQATQTPAYTTLERLRVARPIDRIDHIAALCKGKVVLDIGCLDETAISKRDTVHWLHGRIAAVAQQVVGIDSSRQLQPHGLVTAPNARIHHGDAMNLPPALLESAEFETVVAGEFIEHVEDPLRFLAGLRVAELPTTLQPDGPDRPPHLHSWRDGWRRLRFLLVHAPAWLFLFPGLALMTLGIGLTVPLTPVPLLLGRLTIDIHTLLYAAVTACVGLQMVLFAALSSSHAVQIGVLPGMPPGLGWARTITLERRLIAGLALFILGAASAAVTVWMWSGVAFRAIDPVRLMRVAIPAAALMLAGTIVATSAFLMEFVRLAPRSRSAGGPTSA